MKTGSIYNGPLEAAEAFCGLQSLVAEEAVGTIQEHFPYTHNTMVGLPLFKVVSRSENAIW